MARFNVPIRGYNQFQQKFAQELADILNADIGEIILILQTLPVSVTGNYALDRKNNRDLLRNTLIPIIEERLKEFDYEDYVEEAIEVSTNDYIIKIKKILLAEFIRQNYKRKEANRLTDRYIRELKRAVDSTSPVFFSDQYVRNLNALREAVPYKAATKLSNAILNPIRMYNKTGDEAYLQQIRRELKRTRHYKNALLDATGDYFPDIYNNVYNGMASAGLWTHHRWNSQDPIDEPCISPTGQVVAVGDEFNNGLVAPKVHHNCYCYLTPERIVLPS